MDQYSQESPDYDSFELPPDDFSQVRSKEKTYSSDEFRDTEPKKSVKPQKVIQPLSTVTKPASELLKAKEEASEEVPKPMSTNVGKRGRKPSGKALTNSERQKRWREKNREVALARQRESMKKLRSKS